MEILGRVVPVALLLLIGGSNSWAQLHDRPEGGTAETYNTLPSSGDKNSNLGDRGGRLRGRDSQVGNLPDWAESRTPSRSTEGSSGESVSPTSEFRPKVGRPVPVNGGLVWLVVAGIGYGVFRLTKEPFPDPFDPA
jgi:hypothetical protein